MRHYHITRVLYISLVATVLTCGAVIAIYAQVQPAQAQVAQPFIPEGGRIISTVVPVIGIPGISQLACPSYVLIQNSDPTSPLPQFGLFIPPGLQADIYDYKNLVTPGVAELGGYVPVPDAACGVTLSGFSVFPLFYNAPFLFNRYRCRAGKLNMGLKIL